MNRLWLWALATTLLLIALETRAQTHADYTECRRMLPEIIDNTAAARRDFDAQHAKCERMKPPVYVPWNHTGKSAMQEEIDDLRRRVQQLESQ